MKKIICSLLIGLLILTSISVVSAFPTSREIHGRYCGMIKDFYRHGQFYTRVAWWNRDIDCMCKSNQEKIWIWVINPETGEGMSAWTCRKI